MICFRFAEIHENLKQTLNLEISQERVAAIVVNNWDVVLKLFAMLNYLSMPEGRAFERARAFFRKKSKGIETHKDPLDILNDMEDESVKIDQSQHRTTQIIINKTPGGEQNLKNRIHIDREANTGV